MGETINQQQEESSPTIDDLILLWETTSGQTKYSTLINLLLKLKNGGSDWVWDSWSPTYTNVTVGNGTVTAKYLQLGKTVYFIWHLAVGSSTSLVSGILISLPVAAATHYSSDRHINIGGAVYLDASVPAIYAGWNNIDQSTANMTMRWNDGTAVLSNVFPVTEASGDYFSVFGSYEAGL